MGGEPILEVRDLRTYFPTMRGTVKAVDGISFTVLEGETVGLVGESGCGKSTAALSIMRLVPAPGRIVGGEILLRGRDLLKLSEAEMRGVRGARIAMSFQDPMTFFNPVMRIGDQIAEGIIRHQRLSRREAWEKVISTLEVVGIPSPRDVAMSYPHQLSGGMRQRAMMAMALSCHPELMIADEPTTALDVIIQAQLLELMKDLKRELGMSSLIISHDLGVIAELCERVAVMYAGKIVEYSDIRRILGGPRHPYTIGLLESIPRVGFKKERLIGIEGSVPDLIEPPPGCRFSPRCKYADEKCKEDPPLIEVEEGHYVLCHHPVMGGG
ncbi:ABC transporter ATP-binding protein [Candidatus Bathyarchaeota archaeon]|nr:ABC transporter ATP-binding protein [Candidatus Bathyarchaeota archaeon]